MSSPKDCQSISQNEPTDASSNTSESGASMVDEIHELARRLTSISQGRVHHLFPEPSDKSLDPDSPDFDARLWSRSFYKTQTEALLGNPPNAIGFAFRNLNVYGLGSTMNYQKTVGNFFLDAATMARDILAPKSRQRIDILQGLDGVVQSGELLAVLGPPGSGATTLLKTIAGETSGFKVTEDTEINYQGIRPEEVQTTFRGEAIYNSEFDYHFPHLTVADTLYFAARARCPQNMNLPSGISKHRYAEHLRDVVMSMLGISHTKDTRVGDDFVRGISGGERKRVSIAEALLSYSPLQCWDNSTRGLDSANAIEFCRTLRTQADVFGVTSCLAIYQAPEEAYRLFDKVIVLYQGHQIYFGRATDAKAYFENLGFHCPEQKTTADFLTSMTSGSERQIRPGWGGKPPPRSPTEFACCWEESRERAKLKTEIDTFNTLHPFDGNQHEQFLTTRRAHQSKYQRPSSPFTLSFPQQVRLNLWRSFKLLISEPWMTLTMLTTNCFESLIIASIFYNLPPDSSNLYNRNLLIFYSILINAMGSMLEILTLYAKRKIIEKQSRYALCHPSAEASAAMIVDLPYKLLNALFINVPIYFMTNLRRDSTGPFFFFLLVSFTVTISMSMIFRFLGSITKTTSQALAPSAIILLTLMLFSGFAIPESYLSDWMGWLRWANPVFYAQESLALNEFVGQNFSCAKFVPAGSEYSLSDILPEGHICDSIGASAGASLVRGEDHLRIVYGFEDSHRWRNFGTLVAITIFFMVLYLIATELVTSERSKGEVLVFTRKALKNLRGALADVETCLDSSQHMPENRNSEEKAIDLAKQTSVFHWKDVSYEVKVKGKSRTILDHVDGWVKPGTLTALMGVSGAGKTTLLDVLASRVTMGVVTGEMLVDGQMRDFSFQRKTGYVTQQDLHLHTATVREALTFSAMLRQPKRYNQEERLAYVDTVIDLLGMRDYADAVIGDLGEGLNIEQRKRTTIGVELAARPELLLFLDEPTSGLDSQTSWSICNLMETLTQSGQAILCTIHQPSASLFQRFDRLLLLAKGGRTVYFGDIGKNSHVLLDYFYRNGAPTHQKGDNPAEYMLEVIGAAPKSHTEIDWPSVWRQSREYQTVQDELRRLKAFSEKALKSSEEIDPSAYTEFAADFSVQMREVTKRAFQQYWRSPSYIFSKSLLTFGSALFIGLALMGNENTERGLQNQMFGVYIFLFIFSQMVQQIMPVFVSQRTMYEARERPAKAYSWIAFFAANVIVEMVWNSVMGIFSFLFWYFPLRFDRNAEWTDAVHSRAITLFLICWVFFVFSSTFAHLIIAGIGSAEVAGGLLNLLFILMFAFCGVLAGPEDLPGFWVFMYYANPFTYVVEGFLSVSLANAPAACATSELLQFNAPNGSTCGEYMEPYIRNIGGYLVDGASSICQYCRISESNEFLAGMNMSFGHRWRDFGLMWGYCIFNILVAASIYWIVRVPKNSFVKRG